MGALFGKDYRRGILKITLGHVHIRRLRFEARVQSVIFYNCNHISKDKL